MYKQITTANGWNLVIEGSTEVYIHQHNAPAPCPWDQRIFVGRFKYARPGTNATHFAKFLVKHFTPAEFFAAVEAAAKDNNHGRLNVLEAKGYVSPNMARAIKAGYVPGRGWPTTPGASA